MERMQESRVYDRLRDWMVVGGSGWAFTAEDAPMFSCESEGGEIRPGGKLTCERF